MIEFCYNSLISLTSFRCVTEPTKGRARINGLLKSELCDFPHHENHLGCLLKATFFFPDCISEMIELECSGEKLSILGRVLQRNKTKRLYICEGRERGCMCICENL